MVGNEAPGSVLPQREGGYASRRLVHHLEECALRQTCGNRGDPVTPVGLSSGSGDDFADMLHVAMVIPVMVVGETAFCVVLSLLVTVARPIGWSLERTPIAQVLAGQDPVSET